MENKVREKGTLVFLIEMKAEEAMLMAEVAVVPANGTHRRLGKGVLQSKCQVGPCSFWSVSICSLLSFEIAISKNVFVLFF